MIKNRECPPEELPGARKKSFAMFYGGTEIWFEHLDGMGRHTGLVKEKFLRGAASFQRPSAPSLFALNAAETRMTRELAEKIASVLAKGKKLFFRVAVVGCGPWGEASFEKRLPAAGRTRPLCGKLSGGL
ncbi:MAG: hypothetical protein PHD67_01785 [Oscillospiraceae bacterium]|nr:hypothetical protein [Oscillospiraceae bacterium]